MTPSKRALILWATILCGLYVLLALLVNARLLQQFDLQATLFLQSVLPRALDLPFSILSLLGSVEITAAIFVVLVLLACPSVRVPLVLMFALVALLELQGKTMIAQPGPPDELSRYVFWFGTPTGGLSTPYSYPSGHAARASFLIALAIALILPSRARRVAKKISIALLLAVAATMLISRVYIGDHWMSDVIGGALLGVGLCLFAFLTDSEHESRINSTRAADDERPRP
ncbi:MAG TPA: phosphatase PAP2 family protein [Anaerolineae bacterium]